MYKVSVLAFLLLAVTPLSSAQGLGSELEQAADAANVQAYLVGQERVLKGGSAAVKGSSGGKGVKGSKGKGGSKIKGTKGPKATKAPKAPKVAKVALTKSLARLIAKRKAGKDLPRSQDILVNKYLKMERKMKKRDAQIAAGTFNAKKWRKRSRAKMMAVNIMQRIRTREARRPGRLLADGEIDAEMEDLVDIEEDYVRDLKGMGGKGGKGAPKTKGTKGPKATKAPKVAKATKGEIKLAKLVKTFQGGVKLPREKEVTVKKFLNMESMMKKRAAQIAAGKFNAKKWRKRSRAKMMAVNMMKILRLREERRPGRFLTDYMTEYAPEDVIEDAPEEAFVQ